MTAAALNPTAASYDVLATRVDGITRDFATFQQQIEGRFNGLAGDIRLLVDKFDKRSTTQWPTLIMAAGLVVTLVGGIGGAFVLPMKDNISRLESVVTKFGDGSVSEREFASYMSNAKDRRDDAQRATEARFARVEKDVDDVQSRAVSRGEIETHWAGQTARDQELQRQVDDVRGRVEGIYSPKDELANLHRQVEALNSALSASQSRR